VAGQQITPAVKVRALDALGNVATGFSGAVTVAIGSNPGGATLNGTLLVAAVGGVASFGDLSLNRTATGYTLTASGGGLGPVTSTDRKSAAEGTSQVTFTVQPSNTVAGGAISPAGEVAALDPAGNPVPGSTAEGAGQQITPAVKVRALDALGNVATGFSGAVTVAIGSNRGGATLDGTLLVAAVGGVASFGDLSLNRTATGYTLTASGGGLGPVTSSAFDITPGTAARVAFTVQPSSTVEGAAIRPAVKLRALDPEGDVGPTVTGSVTVG